jgi:type III secretion protein L
MGTKLFSLISGEAIHLSSQNGKVISQEVFSQALDGKALLEKVQEDAKEYKTEVVREIESLKELGYKDGFEAGYRAWAEQLAFMEGQVIQIRGEMEKVLAQAALKAAQKIVGRELETSQDAVVSIVSNILRSVSQHKKIAIYANKEDLLKLEAHRPRIKEIFESLDSLSLRAKEDLNPGESVIETEVGIINARLDNQWKILENAFKTMFSMEALAKIKKTEDKNSSLG